MISIRYSVIAILFVHSYLNVYSQDLSSKITGAIPKSPDKIFVLDSAIHLYQVGNFYISGQPDESIFKFLKEQNLKLVINVRTPGEMLILKKDGFDEEAFLDSLSIAYVNIPIGGDFGFKQEAIEEIHSAIQHHEGKIMIHCRGAGRATNAWMAWLINFQNFPVNDAISLGRKMQFSFYLEDLLGYELSFGKTRTFK